MTREQAEKYFTDVFPVAIDGIVNEDATTEQQDRFTRAILRAMTPLIEAIVAERLAAGGGRS